MDQVKELLEQWKADGFVNPDALESAYHAIILLVDHIELLKPLNNNVEVSALKEDLSNTIQQ